MTKGDARLTATQIYRILRQHLRQLTPFRRDSTDAWCIVFPDSKIAYLPIPKAANSSIRAELLRLLDIDPETVAHVQAFTGFDKRPFSECVKIMDEDWFFFTVVRNPFSRTVSAYMDKLDHHGEPFPALRRMGLFKGDSFARFLRVISLWPKVTLNNHFMPQAMLLEGAMRLNTLRIYKVEHLETDWEEIRREIYHRTGKSLGSLGRRNQTKSQISWKSLYNSRTYRLVASIYKNDLTLFGYDHNDMNLKVEDRHHAQ
jgi:hypothetical protein